MATICRVHEAAGHETHDLAPDRFDRVQRGRSVNQQVSGPHSVVGHCPTLTVLTECAPDGARRTFDAAAWLADWSDHGGIVAVIGDRLWIGRAPCLDRNAAHRLDSIRGHVMRPDAATALRGVLRGNLVEAEA